MKSPRTWLTTQDPFEKAWPEIAQRLRDAPELEVKALFDDLLEDIPIRTSRGRIGDALQKLSDCSLLDVNYICAVTTITLVQARISGEPFLLLGAKGASAITHRIGRVPGDACARYWLCRASRREDCPGESLYIRVRFLVFEGRPLFFCDDREQRGAVMYRISPP